MTDRDELSTADLASQRPDETAADRAPDRDADVRDDVRGDVRDDDVRDDDVRDDLREPSHAPRHGADVPDATGSAGPLLAAGDAEGFRARWTDVQTAFVDSPRESVEQADALVAEVMQHLANTFATERSSLERQWDHGDDVPTDELRTAFQRYRSFFERLLST